MYAFNSAIAIRKVNTKKNWTFQMRFSISYSSEVCCFLISQVTNCQKEALHIQTGHLTKRIIKQLHLQYPLQCDLRIFFVPYLFSEAYLMQIYEIFLYISFSLEV